MQPLSLHRMPPQVVSEIARLTDGRSYAVPDNADLRSIMAQYFLYFADRQQFDGLRWVNYKEYATGEDIQAACSPFYDKGVPGVSALLGVRYCPSTAPVSPALLVHVPPASTTC